MRRFPCAFVLNLDPSSEVGSHWVAVFMPRSREIHYFDSYGRAPNECIRNALRGYGRITHNTYAFQALDSSVCGLYTMYFIVLSSVGIGFPQIISRLKRVKYNTDNHVIAMLNKLKIYLRECFVNFSIFYFSNININL